MSMDELHNIPKQKIREIEKDGLKYLRLEVTGTWRSAYIDIPVRDNANPAWIKCPCSGCGKEYNFRHEAQTYGRSPECRECFFSIGSKPNAPKKQGDSK
jgi:hypothetical protein